jgi:hypothetical protein
LTCRSNKPAVRIVRFPDPDLMRDNWRYPRTIAGFSLPNAGRPVRMRDN